MHLIERLFVRRRRREEPKQRTNARFPARRARLSLLNTRRARRCVRAAVPEPVRESGSGERSTLTDDCRALLSAFQRTDSAQPGTARGELHCSSLGRRECDGSAPILISRRALSEFVRRPQPSIIQHN